MRLPASVLGSLRAGLSATALLAAGCDQSEAQTPPPAPPAQSIAALPAASVEAFARPAQDALGEEIEELVEAAAQTPIAAVSPLVAVAAVAENPTDFVPFAEDPRAAAPIQPRPRVRAPKTRPVRTPRHDGHWATPSSAQPRPVPKWSDGGCPACGRG